MVEGEEVEEEEDGGMMVDDGNGVERMEFHNDKPSWRSFVKWLKFRKRSIDLESFAMGMNSTVDVVEDKHIIMIDFDSVSLEKVEESVIECQHFWYLSDFHIFETKHGFHAIAFDEAVPYSRLRLIIEYARYVDPLFVYISRFYSHKTIRVAGKYKERDIKFVKIIKGVREPSKSEKEIGDLKLNEHKLLVGW